MKIAITGGAGYVGSALVPSLLKKGHEVTVLDTFWYGDTLSDHSALTKIKGDIRSDRDLERTIKDHDAVIHLACISNDPSFELSPYLGKSINYDAFKSILTITKKYRVKKFIYASSSSVYGVSNEPHVTEDSVCSPITDYSKYKRQCEIELQTLGCGEAEWTILRPATVCGYAPRLRLDLVINAMTFSALYKGRIPVHGGGQLRPNINIKDMVRAYIHVLESEANEKTYNVGYDNLTLLSLAEMVKKALEDENILIVKEPSSDQRSYHVNSDRIKYELKFEPIYTLEHAVNSIKSAKALSLLKNPGENPIYHNIKRMKEILDESPIQLPEREVLQSGSNP